MGGDPVCGTESGEGADRAQGAEVCLEQRGGALRVVGRPVVVGNAEGESGGAGGVVGMAGGRGRCEDVGEAPSLHPDGEAGRREAVYSGTGIAAGAEVAAQTGRSAEKEHIQVHQRQNIG